MPLYYFKKKESRSFSKPTERRSWSLQLHGSTIYPSGSIGATNFQTLGVVTSGDDAESRWGTITNAVPIGGQGLGILSSTNSALVDLEHDPILEGVLKTTNFIGGTGNELTGIHMLLTSQANNPVANNDYISIMSSFDNLGFWDANCNIAGGSLETRVINIAPLAAQTSYRLRMRIDHANKRFFASVNDSIEVEVANASFPWTRSLGFAFGVIHSSTQVSVRLGSLYCNYQAHIL